MNVAAADALMAVFSLRQSHDVEKLNKTERAWLSELVSRHPDWLSVQGITLKLGDDCRYTPDFATIEGRIVMHKLPVTNFTFYEVKGFWRDDARVKIKVAARMYPWARFVAVQKTKGGWQEEIIKP